MNRKNELIANLRDASTIEEGLTLTEKLCPLLDLQYYAFSQMDTQDAPSLFKVKFYHTNYPIEWMEIYRDNQYLYTDPIMKRVMTDDIPFYWGEYIKTAHINEDSMKMMGHAVEHGIYDGLGCSYFHNNGQLFTWTMARNEPFKTYDPVLLSQAYLIGAYLVGVYQKQYSSQTGYEDLTEKEKNIASLAAIGKTDAEIALIANISINTVRYHWKNIFRKMDSYSRVFAVIRAMNLGYIDPYTFEVTTSSGSIVTYQKQI